ncbi:erythrocyte membrane protein 1, PfEMP1, putative [Plasmodium sp. gorilla clade G2]|uniref:erythrocyte membrane protein 1, PfEMP1, putative n=1 Tax=Plasmodium sp. gorilla clade G2 TaxID=880535 RepID=UPI000D20BEB6|nr:erythrocyte membrane protein 1, PfEMP1, putative [Plasmodium sp. gorilla clade G2]SOV12006.1 erythrocyte membrane protein 1, PfEMP1, putative [Plasmodium sp. gorilla clade G2]
MGNTESNNKSSLLRNFQYLIDKDNTTPAKVRTQTPQYKLMYFDYLNFLLYEIQHKAWTWDIYKEIVKQNGRSTTDEGELFCGWKKIQEQIFNKLIQELKSKGQDQNTYKWKDDAEPLINTREKQFRTAPNCSFTIDANTIKELKNPDFPALPSGTKTNCDNLTIAEGLHIPLRRRALLVKGIDEYLEEISEQITNNDSLKEVIERKTNAQIHIGNAAVGLTKDMIEGLSTALSNLIKQKNNSNHDAFCKEWYRTMEDYHTLFLKNDIVDENETRKIQCSIKIIEAKVGDPTRFQREWSKYFKELVDEMHTKYFKHPTKNTLCQIDKSEKTQCIRFFEEWAEEFCKRKKDLGEMMITNCKGPNKTSEECKNICTIYTTFLDESQQYYNNYKETCMKPKYGYDENKMDLLRNFKDAVSRSMNECCKDNGDCKDTELFDAKDDKGNLIFNCMCPGGTHINDRDTNSDCQRVIKAHGTLTGTTRGPPPLASASQSISSAACGIHSGKKPSMPVNSLAQYFQTTTNNDAKKDPGNVGYRGEGELKSELNQAKFGKDGSVQANDACSLDKSKHTNDSRPYQANTTDGSNYHDGPCTGKGGVDKDRFKIGKQWKTHNDVDDNHKGVLFPPRRLDMCTSNLENLKTEYDGLQGDKAKHSLLGDVLVTAKTEAENILELYQKNDGKSGLTDPKDKETVCRAMKYSFADIGDIIRGRDIWVKEQGNKQLQERLVKIFEKIKGTVPQGLTTYKNDTEPYLKLREHWWEANRKDIWQAMIQCNGNTNICSGNSRITPHDDYIPQKLRWLTEWSEWYCKRQAQLYTTLQTECDTCKGGTVGPCNTEKCKKCQAACTTYQTFVKEWEKQWKEMETKYSDLYTKAKDGQGNDENEKYLYKFLNQLQEQNKSLGVNNPFESAAGYVHHVLPNTGCEKQTEFCDSGNTYTFLTQPSGYVQACECDSSTPCQIVGQILSGKTATDTIDSCNPKITNTNQNYPKWDCSEKNNSSVPKDGSCMPPRRQKLCLYYLADDLDKQNISKPDDLKKPFIKAAAAETFLHWQYYIQHGSGKDKGFDDKLKTEGTIPEEFKRQMIYTFGDLRDLCLNTDISVVHSTNNKDVTKAKNKIKTIFDNSGQGSQKTKPEEWWTTNGPLIWEGMLCGLSYSGGNDEKTRNEVKQKLDKTYGYDTVTFDTTSGSPTGVTLPQFVERPQFLRWMTEWGEHFCKQHKVQYDQLVSKCDRCNANKPSSGKATCDKHGHECTQCQAQCEQYKQFINKWKPNYTSQKGKYAKIKSQPQYTSSDPDVNGTTHAYEYINKQMQKICNSGTNSGKNIIDCNCMKTKSTTQSSSSGNDKMPASLDTPPDKYKNQCECEQKPPTPPTCTQNKILDAANSLVFHEKTLLHNSGVNLVGDLSKAEFKNKNSPIALGTHDYCNFKLEKHGNDWRAYNAKADGSNGDEHNGPCTGKGKGTKPEDQRFIIGQQWKEGGNTEMRDNHQDVLLPPRRQHMCTSNLENIDTTASGLTGGNVNHSFLGDVLLAAKYEGEDIVHKLSSKSDIPGICNAMKYSFADLGDIIRGKDMWSKNNDMVNLENNLKSIFKKIQENITDQTTKQKYASDQSPYTKLREAWWSANREQVWKALTCSAPAEADLYIPSAPGTTTYKFERYKCGRDSYTPPDDYIPQRLRWMTEWSESYCKQLEKNYWPLYFACKSCQRAKAKKNKEAQEAACTFCSKFCEVYKDHVTGWKGQWNDQEREYSNLYNGGKSGNDQIKKEHENFLQDVKTQKSSSHCKDNNKDTNTYNSLSEYVTSMGGSTYCNDTTQNKFNNDKDEAHVFQEKPKNYKTECEKDKTTKTKLPDQPGLVPPKGPKDPQDICKKVKTCIDANEQKKRDAKDKKGDCNEKEGQFNWECDVNKFTSGEEGACMPHRRQKLCIHYLKELTSGGESELKDAFIKSAALETFFAWKKYKNDKKKEKSPTATNLDEQLKNGNIPSDFLRSIFFTYADYRDLCLDKDIGKHEGDVLLARQNIDRILKQKNGQTIDPKKWWNENGLDILQGMICALSNTVGDSEQASVQQALLNNTEYKYDPEDLDTKIANYVLYTHTVPQFLRWFTEWSEEFCDKQKKEFAQLYSKCYKCEVNSSGNKITCDKNGKECSGCQTQCKEYTTFIKKWKPNWEQQNKHYNQVKDIDPYDSAPFVDTNNHAYTYLYESLELLGLHNNCMQHKSTQKSGGPTGVDMPQALDQYPSGEYKNKCECDDSSSSGPSPAPAPRPPRPPSPTNPTGQDSSNPGRSQPGTGKDSGQGAGGSRGPGGNTTQGKQECKIKEYIDENDKIIKAGNQGGCKPKDDKKTWDCGGITKTMVYGKGECMPPRRQSLCIHYLSNGSETSKITKPDKLKEAFIKCVSLETHLLWQKYIEDKKKDNPSEATKLEDELQKGNIPPEFKRRMFYTFGDFQDLCLGKDIGKLEGNVEKAKNCIDKIFKNSGKNDEDQTKEAWWETIQEQVWNAMLCALSYDDQTKTVKQDVKKNLEKNKYDIVTFGDGPTSTPLSTFVGRPQFLRWMTEWYDDYCKQKHTKLKDVETACKPQSGIKCDDKCDQACGKYKEFMEKRKTHWEKQKKYYTSQKNTNPSPKEYDEDNATEYLKTHITFTCGSTTSSGTTPPSGTNPVETNITALSTSSSSSYYDADEYCGCKKFIGDDTEYGEISKGNNCKGLKKEAEETSTSNPDSGIRWQNIENKEYKDFKNHGVSDQVYIPPRRQRICFEGLDGKNGTPKVENEKTLRERLMKVAATEGYNLGQYYKAKNDNSTDEKYKYDVEACNALKYSFLDLRDIIIGHDMLENDQQDTGKNIKQIFEKLPSNGGQSDIDKRKKWWKENEKCVWKAMLCGYKRGNTTLSGCDKMPDDATYPVGTTRADGNHLQFLRWFAEWGEDYCKHYTTELEKLRTACSKCTVDNSTKKCENDTECQNCRTACQKYQDFINKWKDQYDKQSQKYTEDKGKSRYTTHPVASTSQNAREYLDKSLKTACQNSSKPGASGSTTQKCDCMKDVSSQSSSGTNMPKSLDPIPESVKKKCDCNPVDPKQPPAAPQKPQGPPSPGTPDSSGTGPGPTPSPSQPPSGKPGQGGKGAEPDSNPSPTQPGGSQTGPNGGGVGPSGGSQLDPSKPGGTNQPDGTPVSPGGAKDEFKDLDECPFQSGSGTSVVNKEKCKNLGVNTRCSKIYGNNVDKWTSQLVRDSSKSNKGVIMPSRRTYLCTRDISRFKYKSKYYSKFMNKFLSAVYTEGILLAKIYKKYDEKALQAMKYSFADYGDIIKGKDLMDTITSTDINKKLDEMLKNNAQLNGTSTLPKDANDWWTNNKKKVWHAMLCGYQKQNHSSQLDKSWCTVPTDSEDQFLRWFTEWSQHFCKRRNELEKEVNNKCSGVNCSGGTGNIDDTCTRACQNYKKFILGTKQAYIGQKGKYKEIKNGNQEAHEYLKDKCKDVKCECLSDKFNSDDNWKEPYKTFDDSGLKSKCECQKSSTATNPAGKGGDSVFSNLWKTITDNFWSLTDTAKNLGVTATTATIDAATKIIPDAADLGLKAGTKVVMPIAKEVARVVLKPVTDKVLDKLTEIIRPSPPGKDSGNPPSPQAPLQPSGKNTNNLVTSTLPPVGISFVLGAIALLFYYMKKKTPTAPTDIFRVLNIPQNDEAMPTKTSTNRYVPYGRYKGRTYIYVEGDEPDDYLRDISSSDVTTSSSESEYEEIDLYVPRSPKYKTLIEVVLKPTKSGDTLNNGDIPSGTIPSNTAINEEEWNELKQDFISQYLETIPKDLHNENIIDDNMDMEPNTTHDSMEEKPFITQIQDRKLYSDNDVFSYNIDWNIPNNISTNTPTYNSLYSGIDLINDSLNGGNDIDIYDELLKRKENELFGTKHLKNTTINSVAKQIYDDPILNQLDLYDKWLQRHRNNQWKNKPDNNIPVENVHTTHKLLNTNLSIEISSDMTHDTSNMDMSGTNRYTYLDDMDSFENGSDVI